jgi:hypothetical protein
MSRAAKLQQQEEARKAHLRNESWAQRNPELARDERALRKYNHSVRAAFGHKRNGTPETHARAARVRQGALARLYESGAIDANQLAAAVSIAAVHARITGDVMIGTVSYETRVDTSQRYEELVFEKLGAVRAEVTYTRWRQAIADPAVVLAMVIDDIGVNEAARRFGMRRERAKQLLARALDLWATINDDTCRDVDHVTLAAAHAGIL